jgi:hypothetical protein
VHEQHHGGCKPYYPINTIYPSPLIVKNPTPPSPLLLNSAIGTAKKLVRPHIIMVSKLGYFSLGKQLYTWEESPSSYVILVVFVLLSFSVPWQCKMKKIWKSKEGEYFYVE